MECFGTHNSNNKDCQECLWGESCKYFTSEPKEICSLGKKMVSLDRVFHIADNQNSVEDEDDALTQSDLAAFFSWIIHCDEYTLGIIQALIRTPGITVQELAAEHGVTRQAMHRKMLSAIGENRKLSALFLTAMPKVSKARKNFLRKTR